MFKKIKKSVAVFAVVLMMSSGLNASSFNCFNLADTAASAIGTIYGLSHLQEYNLFIQLYDDCVEFEE
jgi:hypothetical protein